MMGGYGMGPGMMGGYGMGPGMMGGYGMGPGMMGGYGGLDLSDEQQTQVNKIQDETRKAHWALMGEMMDQQARLRDLNRAPKRDNAAIDQASNEFGKLHKRLYDSSVEAQKRMEAVLTKEQQEKLRTYCRKGWAPDK
jgi:Spy/CpxP family protein refolding chaperone